MFVPSKVDIAHIQRDLVILVTCILCKYIKALAPLSSTPPEHILHKYFQQIAQKSGTCPRCTHEKCGKRSRHAGYEGITAKLPQGWCWIPRISQSVIRGWPTNLRERNQCTTPCQDGDIPHDRLQLLEPQTEDWHTLMCFLGVSVNWPEWQ